MAGAPKEILLPLKLVFAVVAMAISYVVPSIWFAASLNARVGGLETGKIIGRGYIERIAKTEGDVLGLQIKMNGLESYLNRIDANVQKILDRDYEKQNKRSGG